MMVTQARVTQARMPEVDSTPSKPLIMVIGYGNSLRRDDGAGIALAETLVATWQHMGQEVRLLTATQLLPEMAQEIADFGAEAVVFVDTTSNAHSHAIHYSEVLIDSPTHALGHHLNPATLLVYAWLLYHLQPRAWLVTIPGNDFSHGEGFSEGVTQSLANALPFAHELLSQIKDQLRCTN